MRSLCVIPQECNSGLLHQYDEVVEYHPNGLSRYQRKVAALCAIDGVTWRDIVNEYNENSRNFKYQMSTVGRIHKQWFIYTTIENLKYAVVNMADTSGAEEEDVLESLAKDLISYREYLKAGEPCDVHVDRFRPKD